MSSAVCASSAASCETDPRPASVCRRTIDVLLLLVGRLDALELRLDLQQIGGCLAFGGLAFVELGALRGVIQFREQGAGLHEIALIRMDGRDLAADLKSDFR